MHCGFGMVLAGEIEEAALFSFASYELRQFSLLWHYGVKAYAGVTN